MTHATRPEDTVDFGYQDVPPSEKTEKVRAVFHSVAERYDVMNDVLSLGVHRLWKRFFVRRTQVRPGEQVLDLAAGTGDIAALLLPKVRPQGRVVLLDINAAMLECGRDRLIDKGHTQGLEYVQADAESLPFPDQSFDCVTMAFGLRNVTHKEAALQAIQRVLKPGGRFFVLEFSQPVSAALRALYDPYSLYIVPQLGAMVSGDAASYRYLVESIRRHPDQETLQKMVADAGFDDTGYLNLSAGIVAIHWGYKY